MKRSYALALLLVLASCGSSASSTGAEPEGLAMTSDRASTAESPVVDVLALVVDGERFELRAGICNTFDDGTFRFALVEGPVGASGQATATLERFDAGTDVETIVAVEGTRDDGTDFSWYARSGLPVHDMRVSLFASSIDGTAVFDSIGGSDTPGRKAQGSFEIRCESDVGSAP